MGLIKAINGLKNAYSLAIKINNKTNKYDNTENITIDIDSMLNNKISTSAQYISNWDDAVTTGTYYSDYAAGPEFISSRASGPTGEPDSIDNYWFGYCLSFDVTVIQKIYLQHMDSVLGGDTFDEYIRIGRRVNLLGYGTSYRFSPWNIITYSGDFNIDNNM